MSISQENLRFVDGDNCKVVFADPKANHKSYRPFREPFFYAPLLTLNADELENPSSIIEHTLRFRAPAIHRYLLEPGIDQSNILQRLFGTLHENKVVHSNISQDLCEAYKSSIEPQDKLLALQKAWRNSIHIYQGGLPALDPEFSEAKKGLQHTLTQLSEAEQVVINRLGIEFILEKDVIKKYKYVSDFIARTPTRDVIVPKKDVHKFEDVWEECFHLLVNYVLGAGRIPAEKAISQWRNEHPNALALLGTTRKKAIPGASYYEQLNAAAKITQNMWMELIVDCARHQRQEDVTTHDMQKHFGLLWNRTRQVQHDIESLAYVRADDAFRTRLDTLFEARGVGSVSSLKK